MADLISVIVPAYNAQKYLPRCADPGLILVDHGSTDRTGTRWALPLRRDFRSATTEKVDGYQQAMHAVGLDFNFKEPANAVREV